MTNTFKRDYVQSLIEKYGVKKGWLIKQMGLTRTVGYTMLREGILPNNEVARENALNVLAKTLKVKRDALFLIAGRDE